jgi:hypothetical protein
MKNIFKGREEGNVVLPLLVLLCVAVLVGWLIVAYLGKEPAPPEVLPITTPVPEPEKEQELSLTPPPVVATPPVATTTAKPKTTTVVDTGPKASLSLTSTKTSYSVGDEILVSVNVSTNADTAGVDVFLEYDQTLLELVKNNAQAPSGKNVAAVYLAQNTESVYGDIPQAQLKEIGGKNVLAFSSLAKPQQYFKGSGVVTVLRFKALRAGSVTIKILSTPGQTGNDSNVAYKGADILKETKNITLIIK